MIAVAVALVLLAYLVLTEWVAMPPFNDLTGSTTKERLVAGAVNYTYQLLVAGGVLLQERWSLVLAAVLAGAQLVSHLVQWWLPYLGLSSATQRESNRRQFGHTLRVLPTGANGWVVDLQHTVVGLLSLVLVITTLGATFAR